MGQKIYDIKPPGKQKQKRNVDEKRISPRFIASLFVTLTVVSAVIYFFSFRAEIIVRPRTEGVELSTDLSVETGSDIEDSLPGKVIETDFLEEYRVLDATGFKDEETRATGTILVENRHWDNDQPLMEGTRFQTEEGKIFRAEDGLVLPGRQEEEPGIAEVEVIADEPGEEFNVEPTDFRLPGLEGSPSYENVSAYSEEVMTGGAVGERTVVSEKDIEEARQRVLEDILEEGRQILKNRDEEFIFEDNSQFSYQIENKRISKNPGEAGEEFEVEIRARVKAITFEKNNFKDFLVDRILESAENNQEDNLKEDRAVYQESLSYSYILEEMDWEEGVGKINLEMAGEVYFPVNESRLVDRARGSSRNELQNFLNRREFIRDSSVFFKPFGIGNIPNDPDRIVIVTEF